LPSPDPPVPPDQPAPDPLRLEALRLAVALFDQGACTDSHWVLHAAGQFTEFLLGRPARLRLIPPQTTFPQAPGVPGVPTAITTTGGSMSVTMTDSQMVTYTVEPEDSKGFPVQDTLTWTASDGGTVLTVTPSADGLSCTFDAVAPGTSTVSVTDGNLSASDLITVTTGSAATLALTPGAPAAEPSPAPPAAPPAG
jgi:hypothetical protein